MNPKPTSSFRRARSVDVIFIIFSHSENDLFALARKQPPPRRNCFRQIFSRSFRTSSRSICRPPGKPTSYHEPRTCMLTFLAPCVCVCSCSCFISFSSAVISLCLSCMLVFHDTFAMLIRMLLLIMPCHYSTLFACHRYKLL